MHKSDVHVTKTMALLPLQHGTTGWRPWSWQKQGSVRSQAASGRPRRLWLFGTQKSSHHQVRRQRKRAVLEQDDILIAKADIRHSRCLVFMDPQTQAAEHGANAESEAKAKQLRWNEKKWKKTAKNGRGCAKSKPLDVATSRRLLFCKVRPRSCLERRRQTQEKRRKKRTQRKETCCHKRKQQVQCQR